jgi:acyl carrier protein phosphodiesterase
MNYLAHAYLSFGNEALLTGNMIADHVKGQRALEAFPDEIHKGIDLHRKIDAFTDEHPATQRAKVWFREDYHLYAGPIMDTFYDHFLANDPKHFPNDQALKDFAQQTYQSLQKNNQYLPAAFVNSFPYMQEHNWLYNYRNLMGMKQALGGLSRRAKYMGTAEKAYELFITNYYALNQCYFELMDDIVLFVKRELTS